MNTHTSVSTDRKSETEILNFVVQHARESDLPMAYWRLPHTTIRYLLVSQEYRELEKDAAVEELQGGFIFAPFNREKSRLFLPGDFIFTFENNWLREPETPGQIASATWLHEKLKHYGNAGKRSTIQATATPSSVPSTDFKAIVQKAIAEIGKGTFEKIVPSHTRLVTLPGDFDVVQSFEKLCNRYPNALVSFVSIPGIGSWLGATPETLVSVEDKTIFKTVALAGTLPYQEGMDLRSVGWTQKEIEEQALVERYVVSCFKKIRIREYEEHGPKTIVAGNLVHLKSEFTVDMKATNFPQLGSVMLQLLHPTSAVCGMPLNEAETFLLKEEGYDREFYSGYLGPVNINDHTHIFVNLRCMKLLDNQALLFAGAGVTIDSLPEKEEAETEMKFNTLLNVIL